MLKIYYYNPSVIEKTWGTIFGTPPLYLNGYLVAREPELREQISWVKLENKELTQAKLVDELNSYEVDILCISMYVWNVHNVNQILSGIKKHIKKDIKIIAGGPQAGSLTRGSSGSDIDCRLQRSWDRPQAWDQRRLRPQSLSSWTLDRGSCQET